MDPLCIKNDWSVDQVQDLLKRAGLNATKFTEINGETALNLTDDGLMEMGIKNYKEFQNVIRNKDQPKVFNDPIHGSIELHPVLVKIIDTPEFQRLRYIKQLGVAHFVYPGACHSRFEHCIGVAHLAGQLGQSLKKKQPPTDEAIAQLVEQRGQTLKKLTDEDILCVQIAGLCHDLGHGPFSHLFDDTFFEGKISHEDISVKMFDHLVTNNHLKPLMTLYGVGDRLEDIRKMIHPTDQEIPENKFFLYEIVSNKTNGIDVDKFDYFARDCHYLGLPNSFDHQRFLQFARVCWADDGKTHICIRDKEVDTVYTMFQTRYCLHRRACQHRVKYGIDLMIIDALKKAEGSKIEGFEKTLTNVIKDIKDIILKDKGKVKGKEEDKDKGKEEDKDKGKEEDKDKGKEEDKEVKDNPMTFFMQLTDRVFEQILYTPASTKSDEGLSEAQKILKRIISRDLYKCVLENQVEKFDEAMGGLNEETTVLSEDTKLVLVKITMDYGMKEKDPIKNMYFYKKSDPDRARNTSERVPQLIPAKFSETIIRVYCKETGLMTAQLDAEKMFETWCKENGYNEVGKRSPTAN